MRIDIREFDNHIVHTYPVGSYVLNEWKRIKKEILVAENTSTNSESAPCQNFWHSGGLRAGSCPSCHEVA